MPCRYLCTSWRTLQVVAQTCVLCHDRGMTNMTQLNKAKLTRRTLPAILISAVAVVGFAAPAAANPMYGIDCVTETIWGTHTDGTAVHYAALAYEIESACGHPATIVWTDEFIANFVFKVHADGSVEYYVPAAQNVPAIVEPVAAFVQVAPVTATAVVAVVPAVHARGYVETRFGMKAV